MDLQKELITNVQTKNRQRDLKEVLFLKDLLVVM